jgi:hypothetical protein
MTMWVADDGSYGTGDVEEFDTTNWTEADYDTIDTAMDSWRLTLAREINHERNVA